MTAGEPPLIIVHGTEDTAVPYQFSEALRDRAETVDISYQFHLLKGVGHGSNETAKISAWTAEFFYPQLWPKGSDVHGPTATAVATEVPTRQAATATAAQTPHLPEIYSTSGIR